jgi:hypothetical protein
MPLFFAVEVTAFRPGASGDALPPVPNGTVPFGTLSLIPARSAATSVIRGSDLGYRTSINDDMDVTTYPPIVSGAFQLNRAMNLDPMRSSVGAAWGNIQLSNVGGRFDDIAGSWNSDNRPVSIFSGNKVYDAGRGYYTDPPYSSLKTVFSGVATPWQLSDTALQIPLRDATYWTENPLQASIYGGTGTYDGTTSLQGQPKPKARGGTATAPIRNVTPVLIDPPMLIYQYTDAAGTVVNAYEGGAIVWTYAGDTTNLYAGTTPAGSYRTDNSRGLIQLGSNPQRTVTLDITAAFVVAGFVSQISQIAYYLMTEELGVPAAWINMPSFIQPVPLPPFDEGHGTRAYSTFTEYSLGAVPLADGSSGIGGVWWGSQTDGPTAINTVVTSFGGTVMPDRNGLLTLFLIRAIPAGTVADVQFDESNVVTLIPQALPSSVQPPTYRVRVGYAKNYTVMSSGVSPSATLAQQQYVSTPGPSAPFISTDVQTTWLRPNDLGPLDSALLELSAAQATANALGALWSKPRMLYVAVMPVKNALDREIGDIAKVVWPISNLHNGQLGVIVGEAWRSTDATIALMVLV